MEKYDLAIIGAGPIGLFAASFANLHGLKTISFDALDEVGGQINMLYPQKEIKDVPAFSSIKGKNWYLIYLSKILKLTFYFLTK